MSSRHFADDSISLLRKDIKMKHPRKFSRTIKIFVAVILCVSAVFMCAVPASAEIPPKQPQKVKVGYYENEVFQEGASEGAIKNGYAYE